MSINTGAISPGTMADDATVGTVAWTNPNNAKVGDNVYATTGGTFSTVTSHYLKATNFGFAIPSGATINGILVEIERKASDITPSYRATIDSTVVLVKADGTFGTTNKADTVNRWPTTDTYKSYGSSSDLWGETWDDTKINDVDFGVALSATVNDGLNEGTSASIDHIRITVYYTPPANRFWVGGSGDWNSTDTSHWALTSGGAGGFPVPTSSDDVTFDLHSNEATDAAYTCTLSGTLYCKSLDVSFTGTTKVTIAGSAGTSTLGLYGNLNLSGGTAQVTWTDAGIIFIYDNLTITTNGVTINSYLGIVIASKTLTLGSNLTSTNIIHLASDGSILDVSASNYTINASAIVLNYSDQTLTLGSGTHTLTGIVVVIDNNIGATVTSTGTIKITNTSNSDVYLRGGGKTYNNIWFSRGASTGTNTITGSNTFADFKDDGTEAHTNKFTDGTDQTITSLTVNGSAGKLITLTGTSSAGWSISDTTGTNTVTYCNIAYSTAEGGATWKARLDTNTNGGNNNGWVFYDPFTNPGNIYSSNNVYATLAATSGILTVEVSKDAGANYLVAKTVTFTASDTLQTVGTGSTELWGSSFTRADMVDANFRIRLTHGGYRQVYKTFGFATGTDILTGIEVAIEGKYGSPTMSLDLLEVKIYYGTSTLVVQAGSQAYDSTNDTLAVYNGANWDDLAPLASPALTGNPTAPTQSANDNSTKLATTAYVDLQTTNLIDFLPRQAIINGNFDVWQRGVSVAVTSAVQYLADRWIIISEQDSGTNPTLTQTREIQTSGDIFGSNYYSRLTTNGAGTSLGVNSYGYYAQRIENGTSKLCGNGKTVTLSFYARSSIAGKKIGIGARQIYGTGGSPSSTEYIQGGVISLTSSWVKYTATITTNTLSGKTFGTANDDYLQILIHSMWGATYGNTAIQTSVAAETYVGSGTIDIAQVQLNAGSVALPFMPKSFEQELQDCQRYYYKTFPYATAPAQNAGVGGSVAIVSEVITGFGCSFPFGVNMRIVPTTLTTYNPSATNANWRDITNAGDKTVTVTNDSDHSVLLVGATGAVSATNRIHFTADAEL